MGTVQSGCRDIRLNHRLLHCRLIWLQARAAQACVTNSYNCIQFSKWNKLYQKVIKKDRGWICFVIKLAFFTDPAGEIAFLRTVADNSALVIMKECKC